MSRSRKKKGTRRSKNARKKPSRRSSRLWRLFLLLGGVFIGLMVPWVAYLNHQVTSEFEGRKWDLPSRVFARALDLYPGALLTPAGMEVELSSAGYRRSDRAAQPGLYRISGPSIEVNRRAFRFHDGAEAALRFEVRFSGDRVASLKNSQSGQPLELVRLEPAEIASIYPLQKEDRTLVSIEDTPPLLVTGLQAVEDRNYKHHPGKFMVAWHPKSSEDNELRPPRWSQGTSARGA